MKIEGQEKEFSEISGRVKLNPMDWGQVLTIIFGIAGFMSIFVFLINKRIDTLENSLNSRIDSLERRMERLEDDIKELRSEMKEIRELLYKVLGAEAKKGD